MWLTFIRILHAFIQSSFEGSKLVAITASCARELHPTSFLLKSVSYSPLLLLSLVSSCFPALCCFFILLTTTTHSHSLPILPSLSQWLGPTPNASLTPPLSSAGPCGSASSLRPPCFIPSSLTSSPPGQTPNSSTRQRGSLLNFSWYKGDTFPHFLVVFK